MPTQEQIDLIAAYGYTVTNTSPLTLAHKEDGIATRRAAKDLISCICKLEYSIARKAEIVAKQREYLDTGLNEEQ